MFYSRSDFLKFQLVSSSLALGHQTNEYTLHSFVVNSTDFGASLYHKIASNVELGAQLGWKVRTIFFNIAFSEYADALEKYA